jgi:HK97 gp10 family phage protein
VADAFSMAVDASAAFAGLDALAEKAKTAVRPAAQAGAQVFYNEVKLNVGKIGKVTGNLDASIYQVYSEDNSTPTTATYHISWNTRKAPHGHLVEFGHIQTRKVYLGSDGKWYTSQEKLPEPKQVAARPFIRPAYAAKERQALEAARQRLIAEVGGES